MVDMTKCMSQFNKDDLGTEESTIVEVVEKKQDETADLSKTLVASQSDDEKMETETLPPERRPSQNSETNNEGQDTPIQTDNDEVSGFCPFCPNM